MVVEDSFAIVVMIVDDDCFRRSVVPRSTRSLHGCSHSLQGECGYYQPEQQSLDEVRHLFSLAPGACPRWAEVF